jgi:pimeloyl-ACP methyl ester carboxylesterase
VLVHGFASSFQHGWAEDGWPDLLSDEGRHVIGFDLPGHGDRPDKPHETSAYEDMEAEVEAGFADQAPVDAVGFSMGARILLTIATRRPELFGKLVVMGVGANLFRHEASHALADAVEFGAPPDQVGLRVFEKMAADPRNDRQALAALMRREPPPLDASALGHISCPVLVILGERDFVGPADQLVAALPNCRFVPLAGVDHFATPKDFRSIDATLQFLDS